MYYSKIKKKTKTIFQRLIDLWQISKLREQNEGRDVQGHGYVL